MSSGVYNQQTGYHNRKSIRLPGYDYSQPGYYFVTICINNRKQRLFGDVVDGTMVSNEMGTIAINCSKCLPERFPNIKLDTFQIMPNHIHTIIQIRPPVGATLAVAHGAVVRNTITHETVDHETITNGQYRAGASPAPTETMGTGTMGTKTGNTKNIAIGDIIGAYKSLVSNECLKIYTSKNVRMGKLWQRNYYEHIIRDEKSLFFIRKYIHDNPINWSNNAENHVDHEIAELQMTENGGAT